MWQSPISHTSSRKSSRHATLCYVIQIDNTSQLHRLRAPLSSKSVLAPRPNLRPIHVEKIRHRHHQQADHPQNRQRPVNAQILIHGNRHLHHPSGRDIPNQRNAHQGTRGVSLVTIDNVLIATDKHTKNPVPKKHAGGKRRPGRDGRVSRPTHPEHADGDGGGTQHGKPEPELWG